MSDEQINLIVEILKNEEENLSDGYQFYIPDGGSVTDAKLYLAEIAKTILAKLEEQRSISQAKNKKAFLAEISALILANLE
jgi:hypothetical protein